MTILTIIGLALTGLQSVLGVLVKSPLVGTIVADVQSAIASLESVQHQVTTLKELESFRNQKLW